MRISDWSSDVCSSDLEYLEERYPEPSLLGSDPVDRAEVRRLTIWFGEKFHREVTANLVDEKIMKRFLKLGTPNSGAIRAGLRSEEHTSELQSLMRISYAVFCLKKKTQTTNNTLT